MTNLFWGQKIEKIWNLSFFFKRNHRFTIIVLSILVAFSYSPECRNLPCSIDRKCGRSSASFRPSSFFGKPLSDSCCPAHSTGSAVQRVLVFRTNFSLSNALVSVQARAFYTPRNGFSGWFKYSGPGCPSGTGSGKVGESLIVSWFLKLL